MKLRHALLLALLLTVLLVPAALAQVPGPGTAAPQPDGPVAIGVNTWLALIGAVAPLAAYLLNHYAPWASLQVKSVVQAAVAAGAGLVYQLVSDGNFGWNQQTAVAVGTAVVFSVLARLGYRMGGIDVALGAGTNSNGAPEVQKKLIR